MSTSVIKCLLIGAAGIGKTSFLRQFPNVQQRAPQPDLCDQPKCFSVETVNSHFDKVTLEIECCDIALETCLHDTDLLVNNKIIPTLGSKQFINTTRFNTIILAFGINNPVSFELVKSKWELDLKKNKNNKHALVLLGLKPSSSPRVVAQEPSSVFMDNFIRSPAEIKPNRLRATIKKLSPKSRRSLRRVKTKRSLSTNSLSSTSKIHDTKQHANKPSSEDEDYDNSAYLSHNGGGSGDASSGGLTSSYSRLSVNQYKKFAKLISSSSENFIQYSGSAESPVDCNASSSLNTYDKFVQAILKGSEALVRANVTKTSSLAKLSRSLTAPLTKPIHLLANRAKNCKIDENHKENLVDMAMVAKIETKASNGMIRSESAFTIKNKLTRFAVTIGTYVVTCGTAKSRKLKNMSKLKEVNENDCYYGEEPRPANEMSAETTGVESKSRLKKKKLLAKFSKKNNKSWHLLSGSQMSLASAEDNVFID